MGEGIGIHSAWTTSVSALTISNNILSKNDRGINLSNAIDICISNNLIRESNTAIKYNQEISKCKLSKNILYCNNSALVGASKIGPIIHSSTQSQLHGMAAPYDVVEVYLDGQLNCTATPFQCEIFLGSTIADIMGAWTLSGLMLESGNMLSASATSIDTINNTSAFSTYIVLPDICELAEEMPIVMVPCSTTGIILDLKQLTNSNQGLPSSCAGTYVNNDAWYKIEVPPTGNFLVRANINNTVVPVIEAYTGNCDGLFLQSCEVLDSLPYAMVFENYVPGTTIYLRIWDKDNNITGSENTALLHLTAHELPLLNNEWEICDQENNLINGNPTILSERDANSFILQYNPDVSSAEIDTTRAYLVSQGATLEDECICNAVAIELWGADNPVELEERIRSAKTRASVDTSNYNYIFETFEFQVNAYAIGMQYATDVAMDAEGNFTLTWIDQQRRHNYGRVYKSSGNPITQEYQIGSSNKTQFEPSVAMQANGDFVTVWHEIDEASSGGTFSIYGRQYCVDGTPKGLPFDISKEAANNISVSTDTLAKYSYGVNAEVAVDDFGNFAVVWHVGSRVFIQRYDNTATLQGQIITVCPSLFSSNNPRPSIAMSSTGDFIVTWSGEDSEEDNGIYMRRFTAGGIPIGSIVQVNTTVIGEQSWPDVALVDNGSAVVVWESNGQDGSGYGIYGQRFDAIGNKVGEEFQVNTYTPDAQRHPSIAMLDDGSFMVAWSSFGQDGFEEGIFAQVFDNNAVPIGGEFQVNAYDEPEQEKPKTATNGNSIFIASWEDGANDGSFTGIFGQRYEVLDIGGTKITYPIGTATPSTLLGQELSFPESAYTPSDSAAMVRVAIIDTGTDPGNPFLIHAGWINQEAIDEDNCYIGDTNGYDFINETGTVIDYDGHGTKVNGVVTRAFDTDVHLEIMNIKFHELNKGKVFDAICGIYYAVNNGADVLNLSWGFEASEFPVILRDALQYASDNDVIIVTTAGNTSKNNDLINKYPCNLDIENMIVVTSYAVDAQTGEIELANYASYGAENVDIAAYGFVETPTLGDSLDLAAGTSLAAPAVTRTAATIKGLYPILSAVDIKDCILSTARLEQNLSGKVLTNGMLDHDAAVACARDKADACVAIDLYITTTGTTVDTTFRTDAFIGSNAIVDNNINVSYLAADSILLDEGFCVVAGAEFLAAIEACTPVMSRKERESNEQFWIQKHSSDSGKVVAKFVGETGDFVTIKVRNDMQVLLDEWTMKVNQDGQFEKIIDMYPLPGGMYQVEFTRKDWKIEKIVQIN